MFFHFLFFFFSNLILTSKLIASDNSRRTVKLNKITLLLSLGVTLKTSLDFSVKVCYLHVFFYKTIGTYYYVKKNKQLCKVGKHIYSSRIVLKTSVKIVFNINVFIWCKIIHHLITVLSTFYRKTKCPLSQNWT